MKFFKENKSTSHPTTDVGQFNTEYQMRKKLIMKYFANCVTKYFIINIIFY